MLEVMTLISIDDLFNDPSSFKADAVILLDNMLGERLSIKVHREFTYQDLVGILTDSAPPESGVMDPTALTEEDLFTVINAFAFCADVLRKIMKENNERR